MIFADQFLPLNSIIHVLLYSDEDLQVNSVNSGVIEKLEHLGNLQENGWFFTLGWHNYLILLQD